MKQPNGKLEYAYELIGECIDGLNADHHAVINHSYRDDYYLMQRIKEDGVTGASCFNSGMDMVELMQDTILDCPDLIKWACDDNQKNDFVITTQMQGCGKMFLRSGEHIWSDGAIQCNEYKLFILKEFDLLGCVTRIAVRNCYPC